MRTSIYISFCFIIILLGCSEKSENSLPDSLDYQVLVNRELLKKPEGQNWGALHKGDELTIQVSNQFRKKYGGDQFKITSIKLWKETARGRPVLLGKKTNRGFSGDGELVINLNQFITQDWGSGLTFYVEVEDIQMQTGSEPVKSAILEKSSSKILFLLN